MLANPRALYWIGVLCFFPFFRPGYDRLAIPGGVEDRFTLGVPASPWLVASWTETTQERGDGSSFSLTRHAGHSFRVEPLAWSWLLVVVGVGFIVASRRAKARQAPRG